MNRFISLIPRYLIKNRKRTFFIALSIVISIILLVGVKATVNALNYIYGRHAVESGYGIYHGSAQVNAISDPIKNNELVESSGKYMKIGVEKFKDKKAVLEIGGFERSTYNLLTLKILQGKYPEKNGEIALDKWAKDKLFPESKIGDNVTIHYEQPIDNLDTGNTIGIRNKSGTWKLVGILNSSVNNTMTSTGKAAITIEEAKLNIDSPRATSYFRVKNEKKAEDDLYTLAASLQLVNKNIQIKENYEYLKELKLQSAIKNIGLFLIIIITIGAVAVIYNIFYITVLERIKEFSILRAVGASKGNIKIIILGEALLLTIVCVPFALIVGYLGIKSFFYGFISGDNSMVNALITKMDIIKISVISSLSIFISALSPAVFGGSINPMEGIKENYVNSIKGKTTSNKVFKTKNITKGINFTGAMAYINMKQSKKRLIATVVSLTISLILVMCSVYLVDMFNPQREAAKATGGDILLGIKANTELRENYAFNDEDIKKIEAIEGIKSIKKHKARWAYMDLDKKYLTEKGISYIESLDKSSVESEKYAMNVDLYGMDDSEIESLGPYLKEGSLNIDNFANKSEVIVVQNLHYKDYTNLSTGSKVTFGGAYRDSTGSDSKPYDKVVFDVEALLSATPIRPIDGQTSIILICSNKALDKYFGVKDYELINIDVDKKTNIDIIKKKLLPIASSKSGGVLTTVDDEIKNMNKVNQVTRTILLGFSAILAVVALVNIANTISINVAIRKRELGILRAVGMSKVEIVLMILKEGSSYGLLSSILGSILGIFICYLIYFGLRADFLENAPFKIPWLICVATAVVTILITTLVSLPSARRGVKNSIVESVKAIE